MRVRVRGSRRASCARTFRVFAACLSVLCASVAQQGIAAASPSPVDLTSLVSPVGPASAGGIASFDIAVTNAGGTQATAPVDVGFHGDLRLISVGGGREYVVRFTHGTVEWIRPLAPDEPWDAVAAAHLAWSAGGEGRDEPGD